MPYNLCVYAAGGQTYGQGTLADYLLAPAVQDAAAGALAEAAEAYSGLTLDVEGLGSAALAGPYADFVALVRKKLARFLRDHFQWTDADEIGFYRDFVPYSFLFREVCRGKPGIVGGVILHMQDDMKKAYYGLHT